MFKDNIGKFFNPGALNTLTIPRINFLSLDLTYRAFSMFEILTKTPELRFVRKALSFASILTPAFDKERVSPRTSPLDTCLSCEISHDINGGL